MRNDRMSNTRICFRDSIPNLRHSADTLCRYLTDTFSRMSGERWDGTHHMEGRMRNCSSSKMAIGSPGRGPGQISNTPYLGVQ